MFAITGIFSDPRQKDYEKRVSANKAQGVYFGNMPPVSRSAPPRLRSCTTCGHQVSTRATACPSCGDPRPTTTITINHRRQFRPLRTHTNLLSNHRNSVNLDPIRQKPLDRRHRI